MLLFELVVLAASTPSASTLPSPVDLVRQIYSLSPQIVLYVTGGGTQLVPWMLATPGASQSVLDLQVPYSQRALAELLGAPPDRCCVPDVARQLALAAYSRARKLSDDGLPCIGLGCTAALRSVATRRGEHRCYIAVCTADGVHELSLLLAKNARSRELEDAVVARCALLGLAASCGIEVPEARDFWRLPPPDGEGPREGTAAESLPAAVAGASGCGVADRSLGAAPIAVEELRWHYGKHEQELR